jgi:hypothetical protein
MITAELLAHFSTPVSVVMATADDALRPQFLRGFAVDARLGGDHVTVFAPSLMAGPTLKNLERNEQVAVQVVCWLDFRAVTLKGDQVTVADANAEGLRVLDDNQRRVVEATTRIVGREFGDGWSRFITKPALALTLRAREVYDQSPGPKAGTRMS